MFLNLSKNVRWKIEKNHKNDMYVITHQSYSHSWKQWESFTVFYLNKKELDIMSKNICNIR